MAERKTRRIADNSDVPGSDPFAELTRIMGFDPRVAGMAPQRTTPQDDAFALDLERELMGELDADPALKNELLQAVSLDEEMQSAEETQVDDITFDSEEFHQDLSASLDADMAIEEAELIGSEDAGEVSALPATEQIPTRSIAFGDYENLEDELAGILEDDGREPFEAHYSTDAGAVHATHNVESRHDNDAGGPEDYPDEVAAWAGDADEEAGHADWSSSEVPGNAPEDAREADADLYDPAVDDSEQFGTASAIGATDVVDDPFAELAAMAAAPTPVPSRPRMSLATPFLRRHGADAPSGVDIGDGETDAATPLIAEPANAWPSFALASGPVVDEALAVADGPADQVEQYGRPLDFDPDAETVAAPVEAIAVVDDLDIPEFDTVAAVSAPVNDYDDLDLDLEMSPADFGRTGSESTHRPYGSDPDGAAEIVLDLDDLSNGGSGELEADSDDFEAFGAPSDESLDAYGNAGAHRDAERQQTWTSPAMAGAASLVAAQTAGAAAGARSETFDFGPDAEPDAQFPWRRWIPAGLGAVVDIGLRV